MSSLLNSFKNSITELREVVNHHYADKDAISEKRASIFTVNYKLWNYVYQFLWSREIVTYHELIAHIKSDDSINSVNWKRIYTILLIVCVYSLFRTRLLRNYEKTRLDQMVEKNKEEVWKQLNKNKEKGVSEWDGDYNMEVTEENGESDENQDSKSSGFSFGKGSKAKYKKNVKLLQKKYDEIQKQQLLLQEQQDDDDLADIAEFLVD